MIANERFRLRFCIHRHLSMEEITAAAYPPSECIAEHWRSRAASTPRGHGRCVARGCAAYAYVPSSWFLSRCMFRGISSCAFRRTNRGSNSLPIP